jgi:hypothetical protein
MIILTTAAFIVQKAFQQHTDIASLSSRKMVHIIAIYLNTERILLKERLTTSQIISLSLKMIIAKEQLQSKMIA